MSRTESPRKHLAVHARKLALEPDLQILRRHRRSLLRRLEQAHRPALADHVHRNARMGPPVLISESWYKLTALRALAAQPCARTPGGLRSFKAMLRRLFTRLHHARVTQL